MTRQPDTLYPPPLNARLRRLALWLALAALAWLGYQFLYLPWQTAYLGELTEENAHQRVRDVMIIMSVVLMVSSAWVGVLALRILMHGRYPLPGAFVWRPTPIETGARARLRGAAGLAAALGLLAAAAWAPFVFDSIAR